MLCSMFQRETGVENILFTHDFLKALCGLNATQFCPRKCGFTKENGEKTGVICYFVCQLNLLSPSKFCPILNKCWVGNMYAVRLVTFRLLPYSCHHIGWICIFEMQIEAYNDTVILSHIRAKRKSSKSPLIKSICTESNINNMCRHKKEGLF